MKGFGQLLEIAAFATAALAVAATLLALQAFVPAAYANSVAPNVIFTVNVESVCEISLSKSISFGTILAGSNSVTTSQNVLDTNNGNGGAFVAVNGGNWIGANALNVFGVSNTVWSAASAVGYGSANALTTVAANTDIAVAAGSSTNVWFGLGIPAGQAADVYSQNIIITNLC